ncbi:MAG: protein TolR [Proteobacteria bacterium]|nr:protein TolR [Pseudomonadota bacterium]
MMKITKKPIAEINVVPYIDVMLVLLVIFMITTPLLTQGVKVDLPQATATAISPDENQPIVVTVDHDGKYYLNINAKPNEVISPEDLSTRVATELSLAKQTGKKRLVLIKGDNQVDYGKIVQAMVLLQQSGAGSVGLVTEPPLEKTV